ncbi:hypothetical protein [Halovivax asiaticus]|nr:hypothetical protein [Halovivax asiaticus]
MSDDNRVPRRMVLKSTGAMVAGGSLVGASQAAAASPDSKAAGDEAHVVEVGPARTECESIPLLPISVEVCVTFEGDTIKVCGILNDGTVKECVSLEDGNLCRSWKLGLFGNSVSMEACAATDLSEVTVTVEGCTWSGCESYTVTFRR